MTKKVCPTCNGKGKIDNPKKMSRTMMYCGPNGEYFPQMDCPNCKGKGFVGQPDN